MFKKINRNIVLSITTIASTFIILFAVIVGISMVSFVNSDFINTVEKIAEIEASSLRLTLDNLKSDTIRLSLDKDIYDYIDGNILNNDAKNRINTFAGTKGQLILGTSLYSTLNGVDPYYSNQIGGGATLNEIRKDGYIASFIEVPSYTGSMFVAREYGIASSYSGIHFDSRNCIFSLVQVVDTDLSNKGVIIVDISTASLYEQILTLAGYRYLDASFPIISSRSHVIKSIDEIDYDYTFLANHPTDGKLNQLNEETYIIGNNLVDDCKLFFVIPSSNINVLVTGIVLADIAIALVLIGISATVALFLGKTVQKPLTKLKTKIDEQEFNQ